MKGMIKNLFSICPSILGLLFIRPNAMFTAFVSVIQFLFHGNVNKPKQIFFSYKLSSTFKNQNFFCFSNFQDICGVYICRNRSESILCDTDE